MEIDAADPDAAQRGIRRAAPADRTDMGPWRSVGGRAMPNGVDAVGRRIDLRVDLHRTLSTGKNTPARKIIGKTSACTCSGRQDLSVQMPGISGIPIERSEKIAAATA